MGRLLWLLLLLWLAQGRELAPQVLTWPASRCEVLWFQAQWTVAIACPGQDLRKVWPWPMEQPWFEDEIPPRLLAWLRAGAYPRSQPLTTASEPTSAYLSLAAAADLLGVSVAELRRRIRLGELANVKIGNQTLVRRLDLERWLAPIQLAGGRTLDRRRLQDV